MEKEVPAFPSWREKLTRTTLAFAVAWGVSYPAPRSDEACEQAIIQSHIEREEAPLLGFTFRPDEARYVGLDPKFALEQLLQMGFDQVRLGLYPNQDTEQMVATLRWEVDLADTYDTDVIFVVGRKNPGYPEEYLSRNAVQETLDKTRAGLATIGHHPRVTMIQVSNEPYLQIGDLLPDDPALLLDLVTILSPYHKPLLFTHFIDPNGSQMESLQKVVQQSDIVGGDVYLETSGGRGSCTEYSQRLQTVNSLAREAGKPLMITELQTLPWPDQVHIPLPGVGDFYIPLPMQQNLEPAEIRKLYKMVLMNTDAESIHFWELTSVLAQEQHGDSRRMNEIRRIIDQNHKTREHLLYEREQKQGGIISFSSEHQ